MLSRSRVLVGICGGALVAGLVTVSLPAEAATFVPTYFPAGVGLDSNAYALQFAGANREGTAAAIALDAALGGDQGGGYPFSTPTTTQPKTDFTKLYGPGKCPTTAVLVADDTPADALAAAALRSYAALPVVDAAGKNVTFNTTTTSLLLTESGREGATGLDATTSAAIAKILSKCSSIPYGIVLGGTAAIPDSVFDAFAADVGDAARLAGSDRFGTAAMVAAAAKTANGGALPTVQYYASATSPSAVGTGGTSLPRTVFLAEGETGADALAVGALAARQGSPILLTETSELPEATSDALSALAPEHIIVLGGTSAVAATVVSAATAAAGAGTTAIRIAGADRYGTSVEIAEQLFNLYPSYATMPGLYSDQLFGIARDEGSAAAGDHVGWPDALASAYYLADLATAKVADPVRTAPDVAGSQVLGAASASTVGGGASCGTASASCFANYPLLLTTGATLDPTVGAYLQGMYPSSDMYKTDSATAPGASDGGFAFIFGGAGAVSGSDQASLGSDLSGGTYGSGNDSDLSPTMSPAVAPFYTTADLSAFTPPTMPVVGDTPTMLAGSGTGPKVCVGPGLLTGVSGVLAIDQTGVTDDAEPLEYYGSTSPYKAGSSLGVCTDVHTEANLSNSTDSVTFYGASLSGHETAATAVTFPSAKTLVSGTAPAGSVTGALPTASPSSGNVFTPLPTATTSTQAETFSHFPLAFSDAGQLYSAGVATLVVTVTRTVALNARDTLSWKGTLTGFARIAADTTPIFTATVSGGLVDATPLTGAPIVATINLLGAYSLSDGGTGAIVLALSPPTGPVGPSAAGSLEISGLS